ncbi:Ribosomal protein [Mactra antiquata]
MSTSAIKIVTTVLRSPLCRCRLHHLQVYKSGRSLSSFRRCYSTEPLPVPNEQDEKHYTPKIKQIVEDISQLSLLEVADLNELLKKTLKIQDAPMMAMGAAAPAAAAPPEEEEEQAQSAQKSSFHVKLTGFDADKKIALIKEIKSLIPGSNLVQAKKFVEGTPVVVRKDLTKGEAEELVKALEAVGGKTTIE